MRGYIVYTDGGYSTSNNVGAGAYIILRDDGETLVKKNAFIILRETSQRAELLAILAAMEALPNGAHALIITDNRNAANGFGRIPKRKGKPDIDLLVEYKQVVRRKRLTIELKWVKSHKGDPWNELCDALCTEALVLAEESQKPKPGPDTETDSDS